MTESTGQISLHQLRRDNVQLLLLQFTEAHLAQGHQAKGVEGLFAEHIGISRASSLSDLRSPKDEKPERKAVLPAIGLF